MFELHEKLELIAGQLYNVPAYRTISWSIETTISELDLVISHRYAGMDDKHVRKSQRGAKVRISALLGGEN